MSKFSFIYDLLLYRPHAYILLSYLHLLADDKELHPFVFFIQDIRAIGSRRLLSKDQVRRNLVVLEERGFIKVEKRKYPPRAYEITVLTKGFLDV